MEFFANITIVQVIGLVVLAAGAVFSFTAKHIAKRFRYEHTDLVLKFVGLGVAIAGFLMIFI
ncbi:hypothetical protein [Christensenella tenuis]|jgi:hypothetical protein|uniref:Uncharacterized protein n=1 Tax=Christensenella tenuis TaxID=2763033 RepID=A0ABR7EC12_9FIRM|nr:hypothetical protein [Christensenella tenuis]MBC5646896.1 hypothetical protein [Christensenella tenuis]